MKKSMIIGMMVLGAALFAADFRIDCSVKKGDGVTPGTTTAGVTAEQASWMGDRKAMRMVVKIKASGEWQDYSFTFVPMSDGYVELQLMSSSPKVFFACDNIRITGSGIKNGSFETLRPDGKPANWWTMKTPRLKTDGGADGRNYVETAHNDRYLQTIACKKDVPVTVTMSVRSVCE